MPNRSESPLPQHHSGQLNFGSQFEALTPTLSRMANFSLGRQRMHNGNFLSPHSNMSPRNASPITSGYNSAHNSFNSSGNSLDAQLSLFQQSQNSNPFIDARLPDSVPSYEDEKTPTLLDVKVRRDWIVLRGASYVNFVAISKNVEVCNLPVSTQSQDCRFLKQFLLIEKFAADKQSTNFLQQFLSISRTHSISSNEAKPISP